MNLSAWLIVLVPFAAVLGMALYCRKYVRSVADYIACGRICNRYVISVGSLEEALSVITLVALIQQNMHTGFAFDFWNSAYTPISLFLGLTGFCYYRFRETKALSLGQFIEMRYSRRLRFLASILRVTAEILTNSIGPAVTVRFFVYFLGLNPFVTLFGITVPTFWILIVLVVVVAVTVVLAGGQIALIVTDCCQALMSYPIFVIFSVFILINFSWNGDILPVLIDRVKGESYVNPLDVENLRDFNVFLIFVTILQSILYRANWLFGSNTAAKSAHEAKMAGLLGTWRSGFSNVSMVLLSMAVLTFMCAPRFAKKARDVRVELGTKLASELIVDPTVQHTVIARTQQIKPDIHDFEKSKSDEKNKFSQINNPEQHYLGVVKEALLDSMVPQDTDSLQKSNLEGKAKQIFTQFKSFYSQMVGPMALRKMFPPALIGLLTLLMLMLMLSTDDSRIFNSSVGIMQDLILPLRNKPLSPKAHLWCLRGSVIFVGLVFIVASFFLAQLEYLRMFLMIMAGLWNAGASPIMIGGFYFRFGTTAGAYASLSVGFFTTLGSILIRNNWADSVYPFLVRHELADRLGMVLDAISRPLNPFIVWKMNDITCPINAIEFTFIAMMFSWIAYTSVSYLTMKQPYNLERALHRGIYSDDPNKKPPASLTWKTLFPRLLGITPEYSKWDKVLAWAVFLYGIIYSFCILFILVLIWNAFTSWTTVRWGYYYWIRLVLVPIAIGIITTIWFFVGGIIGLKQMFHDLGLRKEDELDNGQVGKDGVSLTDEVTFDKLKKAEQ